MSEWAWILSESWAELFINSTVEFRCRRNLLLAPRFLSSLKAKATRFQKKKQQGQLFLLFGFGVFF